MSDSDGLRLLNHHRYDCLVARETEAVAQHQNGVMVEVWASAGARRPGIYGLHDGAVRVKVAAAAEAGAANRAVASLLCEATGAKAAHLEAGMTQRRKRFLLVGVSPDRVRATLIGHPQGAAESQ